MKKVLLDFDGSLANLDRSRYKAVNEEFGTSYDSTLQTNWYNDVSKYLDPVHEAWFWNEVWPKEEFHQGLEPIEDAVESVGKLRTKGYDFMVVSDRPPALFDVTRSWLDAHGLDTVRLLFTRSSHSQNRDTTMLTKSQAAYLYKLSIVVEDSPWNVEYLSARDYVDKVYLLNYSYNQELLPHDKVVRVVNWKEIVSDLS